MKYYSFRTVGKTHAVIVRQPFIATEYYSSGKNKGQIKRQVKCQYNEMQTTIEMDSQVSPDPNLPVTPTPVFIMRGVKNISEEEPLLLEMFRRHPDNIANGGRKFKEYDVEREELLQVKEYEMADRCKVLLGEADDTLIRSAAVWFLGNKYLSKDVGINKMKLDLRNAIDMNLEVAGTDGRGFVSLFKQFMEDKSNDEKLMVSIALHREILKIVAGKKICWTDSGDPVFIGSHAKDVVKEFATWLKTDKEGRDVAKLIAEKIN